MSHFILQSLAGFSLFAATAGAQMRMVAVDESAREVTVRNFSTTNTVNAGTFWLCIEPLTYQILSTLNVAAGDLMLSPGEQVTVEYFFTPAAGGIGLYNSGTNFASPNNMVDYLQYAGVVGFRQGVAVQAGLWTANTFANGASGPFFYFGDGTENGAEFWSNSSVSTFCVGKTSSAGCVTSIGSAGTDPAVSGSGDFSVTASQVQGFRNGLIFVGVAGPAAIPFSGGTLCVQPPTRRGPIQNSGGTSPATCDGTFNQIVNDGVIIPAGLDPGAGNTAWYQWWYRDPQNGAGNLGTALSNGAQVDFL